MPTSSPNRAVFEPRTCLFRAQLVPFSSPRSYSFEPKSSRFRARTVHLSSPVRAVTCGALFELLWSPLRAVIEPSSAAESDLLKNIATYLTASARMNSSTGCQICCDIFQQVTFSRHNRFDSWKLTHLGRFVQKNQGREEESF